MADRSKDCVINLSYFGKIKEVPLSGEAIKHFITTVVYNHPNWGVSLKHLSDIYVLVASSSSQKWLKDGDKTWKEIMKKDEYDILEKNREFIVAYMLVTEKAQNYHTIDWVDTIIGVSYINYLKE